MYYCPWCHSDHHHPYLAVKDHFLSKESFEVLACEQCGLLFTAPRPAPDRIGSYYESDEYLSHQENKSGLVPTLYEKVKAINLKNKRNRALSGLDPGRLLDIGCGVGDFLRVVKEKNWDVAGIEPSVHAKSIAEKRLGFTPLDPSEAVALESSSFDVITMWHVLEHIDDLHRQVDDLHRLLRCGGRLVIALPNYQSFDATYYQSAWAAWDVPRHLNHFSPAFLIGALQQNGFKHLDTQGLKWDSYYISYLSERYLEHGLPLLRGAWRGWQSNLKAHHSGMYSSLVDRFEKIL